MLYSLPVIVKVFLGGGVLMAMGYALVDCTLLSGLRRLRRGCSSARPRVSVLVSARNEEKTIEQCLSTLIAQSYPAHLYEILITNDRSEDSTGEILDRWAARHPDQIRVIHIDNCPEELSPKKCAITQMMEMATGEIICTTDADCLVSPVWIEALVQEYEPEVEMVVGHSEFDPSFKEGWLQPVQALEFLSHSVIAAGSIGAGYPLTCTGNNFSYRRDLFYRVGGYEGVDHILSGDDDLLLRKAARHNAEGIRYCLDAGSFVLTRPQRTGRALLTQRSRWASTTITYETPIIQILGGIFLWYCWIIFALLLGLAGLFFSASWGWAVLIAGIVGFFWKTFWDEMVTRHGARLFRRQHLLSAFIPTALLHIPMIVTPVIFGVLGKFQWKGRSERRTH